MKPLDNVDEIFEKLEQSSMSILFPYEISEWSEFSSEEKHKKIQRICTRPLCNEDFTVAYSLYFRFKWMEALKRCVAPENATVLEVGSGSSVNIPNALTKHDKNTKYITANMNKELTAGLKRNTASLPISIEVIEDDAVNIRQYLPPDSVDAIVFEHSVNDILQAILCESKGMDTVNTDWFALLPEMIQMISSEYVNDTLVQSVKSSFLTLIENCISVLKPNGFLIMSHYMFQYDLDLGYNPDLWENILPIVRPWLQELKIGKEVSMESFDSQWWLFYQK